MLQRLSSCSSSVERRRLPRQIRGRLPASCATLKGRCCQARPSAPSTSRPGDRIESVADDRGRLPAAVAAGRLPRHRRRLTGYRRVWRDGVILQLGQTLVLDFTLDVGGLTEEIRVTALVPLPQAANAEISDVIENREVVQLPLNGRNVLSLAQLSDAVVIPPGGTRGEALQQAGPLPNVGGQRSGHTSICSTASRSPRSCSQPRHQPLRRLDSGVPDPDPISKPDLTGRS
jgi:hypothetical protein